MVVEIVHLLNRRLQILHLRNLLPHPLFLHILLILIALLNLNTIQITIQEFKMLLAICLSFLARDLLRMA